MLVMLLAEPRSGLQENQKISPVVTESLQPTLVSVSRFCIWQLSIFRHNFFLNGKVLIFFLFLLKTYIFMEK